MYMKSALVLCAPFLLLQGTTSLPVNGTRPNILNQRDDYNLQDVVIGCNEDPCPIRTVLVNANAPKWSQTCPRRALAALANYLEFCEEKRDGRCLTPINTPRMPSIADCCGDWVHVDDPYYQDYPTMRDPETGEGVPLRTGAELYAWPAPEDYVKSDQVYEDHRDWVFRKVIKPNAWEYKTELPVCGLWLPWTEPQFQYFMQNLLSTYHLDEVQETLESNTDGMGPPNDP